jgi:hypothetical protein
MRKTLFLFLLIVILTGPPAPVLAQDSKPDFRMTVEVNSAFVHAEPSVESPRVASVFEDQILEAMGRNVDGTWVEVRRPGRLTNLGWLPMEFLSWDFFPEALPLTNLTVGVEGPVPLTEDPGFAVYLQSGVIMRDTPSRHGNSVGSVPRFATVPVLARNQDGTWLKVNYRGYVGWIIAFTGRDLPDLMAVPVAPDAPPPDTPPVVIIPPEVQLAHIQSLRDYIIPRRALADGLVSFWLMVLRGEIMPCNPPESITMYQYTRSDVRELPELGRYAPQLGEAVSYLNTALDPLQNCGVVTTDDTRAAYATAINARILLDSTLEQLDSLEQIIKE